MDSIQFEKDLIAVLLVVESAHDRNRLLYKYEEIKTHKQMNEPVSFYTPYSIVIAKDFDPPNVKDDDASRRTFLDFDETTLSILTNLYSYGNHVEVQVDDVIFVGHTLGLENNDNLKSFAIFFALRAIAKASVILSYQEMSKRIGTAIRCEEQRASYLNQEYAKLISVLQQHDVEENDRLTRIPNEDHSKEREEKGRTKENIYATMVEQSVLAYTLKQIYTDLQKYGEINITINNWLTVSCCLPHRSVPINCPLDCDEVYRVLSNAEEYLKSYYGIVLVIDPSTLLASLPTDSSSTLNTFVRHLRSQYSLSHLSVETGIPLSQIFRLTAHLVFWGRAKIIYPIHDESIYIISPDADISKQGSLSKMYKETFKNASNNYSTLQEALAEYSDAIEFYDHISQLDNDSEVHERIECVEWLLRHRLLIQVHYYYYLVVPNEDFKEEYKRTRLPRPRAPLVRLNSELLKPSVSPTTNQSSLASTHNSRSTDTLKNVSGTSHDEVQAIVATNSNTTLTTGRISLHYLPQITQALPGERPEYRQRLALAIKHVDEQYVATFLKIIKYLNGTYHLDEIASLENMTRSHILTTLEQFQSIVIPALHPDPNPILQI